MTTDLQHAKQVVLDYYAAIDNAPAGQLASVVADHTTDDYSWRGVHPFGERHGAAEVAEVVLEPLRAAFSPIQRRPDVFLAGHNTVDDDTGDGRGVWVCQMGHLLGLFDQPWLDIPPTGQMCFLRFAEFHRVSGDVIAESALFLDVISVMAQAGQYPLPPQTGASRMHLGPLTHDGVMIDGQDPERAARTMAIVDKMIDDLSRANEVANTTGDDRVPPEALAESWHEDMIWSGPEGIGATYTIRRYQHQHQYPFRFNLTDKHFNGHVARFAEGNYACFFGWPNLSNRASGGFLGLPAGATSADMRVVDVYRRDGDKLAENWVFIDLLYWLDQQGLDVLARMRQLLNKESF